MFFKGVTVDEWITLTWMLKNWVRKVQIWFIWLRIQPISAFLLTS